MIIYSDQYGYREQSRSLLIWCYMLSRSPLCRYPMLVRNTLQMNRKEA